MTYKKITLVLIVFLFLISLTGCWDKGELNESAIVVAMGIDRNENNGDIDMTLQFIRPGALNQQQGSNESPYDVINASGESFLETVKKANEKLDRKLSFAHLKTIIIGEKMAKTGVTEFTDYLLRTFEMRQSTLIAVTPNNVSQVLAAKHGIENVQATYMEGIVKTQKSMFNSSTTDVLHFINKMETKGLNPVTGVFTLLNQQDISFNDEPQRKTGLLYSGTAVFRADKLVGYLNSRETRGLNYIINGKSGGYVLVPSPNDKSSKVSIELSKIKNKITPIRMNGSLTFCIHVEAEGNIAEITDRSAVSKQDVLKKINQKFTDSITKDIRSTVNRSQKKLKTDILGFGRAYEKSYPSEWDKVKDQWASSFPTVPFKVKVKTEIKKTGLQINPLGTK
ncbi:Ger(x)C family spore germination protein [Sporolactobacillus shoreicorticis]|uniref:Ger(X)C family spore germination protein n=1 Tax=Sporolactobacillus shoreicorticis TaxID=1923877 RepID=A0ABW5S0T2_9BACL|nr:Ger(x)C family spore germination protein [Sporolactobacillus shoreicorticis]MCO7124495.1 Ger(x)C family spore germination protein [Sporolactobacillus shoreicorticis]